MLELFLLFPDSIKEPQIFEVEAVLKYAKDLEVMLTVECTEKFVACLKGIQAYLGNQVRNQSVMSHT